MLYGNKWYGVWKCYHMYAETFPYMVTHDKDFEECKFHAYIERLPCMDMLPYIFGNSYYIRVTNNVYFK